MEKPSSAPTNRTHSYYYNCENLQAVRKGPWKLHLPRTQKSGSHSGTRIQSLLRQSQAPRPLQPRSPITPNPPTSPPPTLEVVQTTSRISLKSTRAELGEFMQRGSAQRPTGSLFPDHPVISHEKDWGTVPAESAEAIAKERSVRHPDHKKPKVIPRRKKK